MNENISKNQKEELPENKITANSKDRDSSVSDYKTSPNFIKNIIEEDLKNNKNNGRVHTRFPPEPNGYLHIGHAKSISLNFGFAAEYNGLCNLRFDDTNPQTETPEYVDSIKEDIHWLGFDWEDRLYYASDYFEQFYEYAEHLIKTGKAYVCALSEEEIRKYRGTVKEPGKESPYRNRPVEENLEMFRKMKAGEYPDGSYVLRAKIDMASPNMKMRDPLIYRIRKIPHYRTGDKWCIYPFYDYAHCLSDSIEGITHSLCTLEFDNNRELYDWFLDQLPVKHHPQQIEFARLNLTYTIMSKRKLLSLVEEKYVSGWDDPRMPTIAGIRRRGYTPSSIKKFSERIGIAKSDSVVDIALLEHCLREEQNALAQRAMVVLNPLKLVITNYPEDRTEQLEAVNNPEKPEEGKRKVPFSREVYIERDDFMEDPPQKFYRLSPGKEVRLRYAYLITCQEVIKDNDTDEIVEIHCTYDPATRGGTVPDNRKVKGTIHWVDARESFQATVRLYEHLFTVPNPGVGDNIDFRQQINPDSLKVLTDRRLEPMLKDASPKSRFQFERQGYFFVDPKDSQPGNPVFNRIVSLKDSWARMMKKEAKKENK